MNSLKYVMYGSRILDPNRTVILKPQLQGISLIFKYPILIPMYLSVPFGVYLIGVAFLLYSKYLDRKISKLSNGTDI